MSTAPTRGAGVFEILHHDPAIASSSTTRSCVRIVEAGSASQATSTRSGPKGRAPQARMTPSPMRAPARRNPYGNAGEHPLPQVAGAACAGRHPACRRYTLGPSSRSGALRSVWPRPSVRDVPRVAPSEHGRQSGHDPGVDDQRFLLEPQAAFHEGKHQRGGPAQIEVRRPRGRQPFRFDQFLPEGRDEPAQIGASLAQMLEDAHAVRVEVAEMHDRNLPPDTIQELHDSRRVPPRYMDGEPAVELRQVAPCPGVFHEQDGSDRTLEGKPLLKESLIKSN